MIPDWIYMYPPWSGSMGEAGSIFRRVDGYKTPLPTCIFPVVYRWRGRSGEDRPPAHSRRHRRAEPGQHRRRDLRLAQNRLRRRPLPRAEIIERHLAHRVGRAAMVAADSLAVIGGQDHLIPGLPPGRQVD